MLAKLDALLPTVELGRGWVAEKGAGEGRAAWSPGWPAGSPTTAAQVVATELDFTATVGRAVLSGRVDRIERDEHGRAVVVDLKTGSRAVAKDDVPEHAQLAAYQLAVEAGAFADLGLTESGGAALLQVGKGGDEGRARAARRTPCPSYPDPDWARRLVTDAAEGMAGSAFQAVDNDLCKQCPVRTSCPVQDDGRTVTVMTADGRRHGSAAADGRGAHSTSRIRRRPSRRPAIRPRSCARTSSSPAPARARPRRWACGWPGWSPTGWSSRTASSG